VINPEGKLQKKFDKIHLFDIDIPGKITYKESETFEKGS
jgi:omega-amidase